METEFTWQLTKNIKIQAGYQLLYTADKDQRDKIKAGTEFGRVDGTVYRLNASDYKGLFGRSKHMGNLKLFYENKAGWFANIRNIYRSGWGVVDTDGNLYLNRGDQFAQAFIQTNISAGKTFKNGFKIQAGSDNIFNHQDVRFLPEQPGRIGWVTIAYAFTQQTKK